MNDLQLEKQKPEILYSKCAFCVGFLSVIRKCILVKSTRKMFEQIINFFSYRFKWYKLTQKDKSALNCGS